MQMKAQQVRSKANEEAMFSENQRLLNELALSRCVSQSCLFKVNVRLFMKVSYVLKCIFSMLFVFFMSISTREQLHKTSRAVGNVCSMDHTQRITDLLAQLNTFQVSATEILFNLSSLSGPSLTTEICLHVQRNEDKLSEDIHRLKQEKQSLDVDLQLMKKERDLAKAQAMSASGKTGYSAV